MTSGRIIITSFESKCLKDNPLNDPYERDLIVYLPPEYDSTTDKYPVLFILAGFTGRGINLINKEAFSEPMNERLDRLIQTKQNCSYWAIAGKSSGGYGALSIGIKHPTVFNILACHSGDMGFEYCYLPDFPLAMLEIEKQGGITQFMQYFYSQPKKTSNSMVALNTIAMSAAYSPNKSIYPHFIDLPFDAKTGEIRNEIWEKWLSYDPINLVNKYRESAVNQKIYFDCGIKDEFRLFAGSRIFSSKLTKLEIDHTYEEFDDSHMKVSYRYDQSLKFISQSML